MRVLLTGVAGFIGSTLAEHLINQGHEVLGVDSFTDYYDVALKRRNLRQVVLNPRFTLIEADILALNLAEVVSGIEAIVHLAGQPGVRLSWEHHFQTYLDRNVVTTQRLLEALRGYPSVPFLFASSSSVYGDAERYPCRESDALRPRSPYGVTKAAAESLTYSYAANLGLRSVALRFFTVYGPRQRPDMATSRLVEAALDGTPFTLFGDGTQLRDFTYIDDICRAISLLLDGREIPLGMTPLNIGGSGNTSMLELIELVERAAGRRIDVRRKHTQAGDVFRTGADITLAESWLGWRPEVDVATGVVAQVQAERRLRDGESHASN